MIPPRWLFQLGWAVHRALFAASGGRLGTARPSGGRIGTLFLVTTGRTTGQPRRNGVYYMEDGANLVVVASNAGAAADPAWWRNLQAQPLAEVQLGTQRRAVRGRLATPEERARLWRHLVAAHRSFADYAAAVDREIPVVILEPEPATAEAAASG
jgi:deazaflavin-dependent oxidoreductase (nitroreductase family)